MKSIFLCAVLGLLPALPAAAAPQVQIVRPGPQSTLGDELSIEVQVESLLDITAMTATVDSVSAPLELSNGGAAYVTLPLRGLPGGDKELVVTVTDENGETAVKTLPFVYVPPPTLTSTLPANGEVIRNGVLTGSGTCKDAGQDCRTYLTISSERPYLSQSLVEGLLGAWNIDQPINQQGSEAQLNLIAVGNHELIDTFVGDDCEFNDEDELVCFKEYNTLNEQRDLYFDPSEKLLDVAATPGNYVIAADNNRALFLHRDPFYRKVDVRGEMGIYHRGSEQVETIPGSYRTNLDGEIAQIQTTLVATLTPKGVFFASYDPNDDPQFPEHVDLFDFRPGELTKLGTISADYTRLQRIAWSSQFAAWGDSKGLSRINFTTGEVENLSIAVSSVAVGDSGAVAFARPKDAFADSYASLAIWNPDGSFTELGDFSKSDFNKKLSVSGDTLVYNLDGTWRFAALSQGTSEVVDLGLGGQPPSQFIFKHGYVAYAKYNNTGHLVAMLRSPDGQKRLLSEFEPPTKNLSTGTFLPGDRLEDISAQGDVIAQIAGKRVRFRITGEVEELSSALGKAFYFQESLLIAMGRRVFAIDAVPGITETPDDNRNPDDGTPGDGNPGDGGPKEDGSDSDANDGSGCNAGSGGGSVLPVFLTLMLLGTVLCRRFQS